MAILRTIVISQQYSMCVRCVCVVCAGVQPCVWWVQWFGGHVGAAHSQQQGSHCSQGGAALHGTSGPQQHTHAVHDGVLTIRFVFGVGLVWGWLMLRGYWQLSGWNVRAHAELWQGRVPVVGCIPKVSRMYMGPQDPNSTLMQSMTGCSRSGACVGVGGGIGVAEERGEAEGEGRQDDKGKG